MARQKTLQCMFSPINKEEMEVCVERDFAALSTRMELEKAMEKEVVKRRVGRPKKQIEAVLFTPEVEKAEGSAAKKTKVRGNYTNWFMPSLWEPIYAAMRYLKTKYKLPGKSDSVYEDLTRGSLWDWFTPTGQLREGVSKKIYNETSSFSEGAQHSYVLSNFRELEDEIIEMLKAHRDAGQPLFISTVRGRIRSLINKRHPRLLQGEGKTAFRVSIPWTRDFVRRSLNWS